MIMTGPARIIASPQANVETVRFWEAANEGVLLIKICKDCGESHYYPRAFCPFCFSERTEWRPASGRGTIYSYSVARRAAVPYALSYVSLEEGPTIMTNIVDADFDAVRIGQRVRLVFKTSENAQQIPMFTLA